jgi:integral membrane sensor domain MASE1
MVHADRFIWRMRRWPYFIFVNLLLALGIFLCAILGRSLGIQGPALRISVVWPATGLSLAGLLIFGDRARLGVLVGNLAYNFVFLKAFPPTLEISPFFAEVASVIISLGSFAQALLSAYILRTYSLPPFFRSVHDIFLFLIPASLLSCLIGSVVGVTSLYIVGSVENSLVLPVWLTFWLGDTVGIYVITPLLVVWALQRQEQDIISHLPSIIGMATLFILFSFVTYYFTYPLPHLFVPISIWASYLFRMHGASLAIFLMTAASIAFAASQGYEGTSLITFIAVTVAASLIIAAVVNERVEAWALLDSRNVYLEQEVELKTDVIQLARSASDQKRKLVSLGIEAKRLSQEMQDPLDSIENSSIDSQDKLEEMAKLSFKAKLPIQELISQIQKNISEVLKANGLIKEMLDRFRFDK